MPTRNQPTSPPAAISAAPLQPDTASPEEKELFAAVTKHHLAGSVSHLRDFYSVPQLQHREKYADLIEAQAKLIAYFVNNRTAAPSPDTRVREALETSERLHRYHNNLPEAELCAKALSTLPQPGAVEPTMATAIQEQIAAGDGIWTTCTGCYEGEDGQNVGYPHSKVFGCTIGGGCGECGGIGAIWDTTDYGKMADELHAEMIAQPPALDPATVEEALRPFAALADMAHVDHRDSRPFIFAFDTAVAQRLTIGDLRRAKRALTGKDGT